MESIQESIDKALLNNPDATEYIALYDAWVNGGKHGTNPATGAPSYLVCENVFRKRTGMFACLSPEESIHIRRIVEQAQVSTMGKAAVVLHGHCHSSDKQPSASRTLAEKIFAWRAAAASL